MRRETFWRKTFETRFAARVRTEAHGCWMLDAGAPKVFSYRPRPHKQDSLLHALNFSCAAACACTYMLVQQNTYIHIYLKKLYNNNLNMDRNMDMDKRLISAHTGNNAGESLARHDLIFPLTNTLSTHTNTHTQRTPSPTQYERLSQLIFRLNGVQVVEKWPRDVERTQPDLEFNLHVGPGLDSLGGCALVMLQERAENLYSIIVRNTRTRKVVVDEKPASSD